MSKEILQAIGALKSDFGSVRDAVAQRGEQVESLRKDVDALLERTKAGEGGMIVPVGDGVHPGDQRDPALQEKEGKWDWVAFMRMVVFKAAFGDISRAARLGTEEGSKERRDADFTLEQTLIATERRDLNIGTGTAGGYIVPPDYRAELIELLRARLVLAQAGIQIWDNLMGSPVTVPVQDGAGTGAWVGENAAVTAADQSFAQKSMVPHKAAAMTKLSNELLKISNPAVASVVRNDLVNVLARLIELAQLRGSGTGAEPEGYINVTGIVTVSNGVDGGTPTWAKFEEMLYQWEAGNGMQIKPAWVMHPRTVSTIRQFQDTQNRPFYLDSNGGVARPGPMTLFGFPILTTTQIPINLTKGTGTDLTEVFFTDWNEIILAMWGDLEIAASDQTSDAFEKYQTWIRAIHLVDNLFRQPAQMIYMDDAAA